MRQTTNVFRKECSANTVLVVRLLWGRSRGCAMDWDEWPSDIAILPVILVLSSILFVITQKIKGFSLE